MKIRAGLSILAILAALSAPLPALAQVAPPQNTPALDVPDEMRAVAWCGEVLLIVAFDLGDDHPLADEIGVAEETLRREAEKLGTMHGLDWDTTVRFVSRYTNSAYGMQDRNPDVFAAQVEACMDFARDYFARAEQGHLRLDGGDPVPNVAHSRNAAHWHGEELQYSQDAPAAAITAYDRALELDPDHLVSLLGRAEALRRLNRHEAALADLDRAITLGADWTGYLMRARSREATGDAAGAIADYRSVLAEYPGHIAARQRPAALGALPEERHFP